MPNRRKIVRGRADPASGYIELPMRPEVGSATVGRQRQILIQTNSHPRLAGVLLDAGELAVDVPLQPAVEENFALVFSGKLPNGVAVRIAKRFGPVGPDPEIGVLGMEMLVERTIRGIEAQEIAFAGDPSFTFGAGRAGRENELEGAAFQGGDLLIFDDRRRAQARQFRACPALFKLPAYAIESGNVFYIEIQKIAVIDTVRQIRTGVIRTAIVNGMQRIEGDEVDLEHRNGPID